MLRYSFHRSIRNTKCFPITVSGQAQRANHNVSSTISNQSIIDNKYTISQLSTYVNSKSKDRLTILNVANSKQADNLFIASLKGIPPLDILKDSKLLQATIDFIQKYDNKSHVKHWDPTFILELTNIFKTWTNADRQGVVRIILQTLIDQQGLTGLGLSHSLLIQTFLQQGLIQKAYEHTITYSKEKRYLNTTLESLLYHLSVVGKSQESSDILMLIITNNHKVYQRTLSQFIRSLLENKEDQLVVRWCSWLIEKCFLSQETLLEMAESVSRVHALAKDRDELIEEKEIHFNKENHYIRQVRQIHGLALSTKLSNGSSVSRSYERILTEMKSTSRGFERGFKYLIEKYKPPMKLSVYDYPQLLKQVRVSKHWRNIKSNLYKRVNYDHAWQIKSFYLNMVLWRLVEDFKASNDQKLLKTVTEIISNDRKLIGLWTEESLRILLSLEHHSPELTKALVLLTLKDERRNYLTSFSMDTKFQFLKLIINDESWRYSFQIMNKLQYFYSSGHTGSMFRKKESELKATLIEKCAQHGYLDRAEQLCKNGRNQTLSELREN